MKFKSASAHLCGLLLAIVPCETFRGFGAVAAPKGPAAGKAAAERFTPGGKKAVESILQHVRQTGSFNHPDYPWVVRARQVRGDTLYFVEFLYRRADGKGFDWVGKAVQATLSFSEEYRPFALYEAAATTRMRTAISLLPKEYRPFALYEAAAPARRDTLRVQVHQMEMQHQNGTRVFLEERVIDLSLPARLRENGFRPYAEAEAHLSSDQREALDKEYSLHPEQKLLLVAFGDECADLLQAKYIARSEMGQTVLACQNAVPLDSGRRTRFGMLAVARFDRTGEVLMHFQGKDITAETSEVLSLLSGDDSESFTLKGPGGLKLVLPGTKAGR